ncbi:hypothetical protein NDU88_007904 [Pleurodeles waltl]|uniref:Uncharacterized protein n=1 Tax=Pleurodeles waltl TaxID=8319 RepID=A0AAV7N779_PLEWA|nr:hypothetical protein NDU88_007904 [Pleurodeles waltl]
MERMPGPQQSPACLAKLSNPTLEKSSPVPGMDFSHMYQLYKPRRGLKRSEDSKDTYKLPHRLIEKKRRDRINECIAQLKDLLPEHLKLTTLGHLEKAVVLELTLKHVKALTNLIEQQQQKIISLQSNGAQAGDLAQPIPDSTQEVFRSGFQVCAKEVLQYLAEQDSEGNDLESSQLVGHLQRVAADVLHGGATWQAPKGVKSGTEQKEKPSSLAKAAEGHGKNCVPVIQRTYAHSTGEQSGSDTDTDSGYGGELEKSETTSSQQFYQKESPLTYHVQERVNHIKKESEDIPAKRPRKDISEDAGSPFSTSDLMASQGFLGPNPHQHPLCLPFYLLPPSTAAYLPMLEKCWYPGSMPMLYPGLSASTAALSGLMGSDKGPSSLLMPQRLPSPGSALSPLDSSALMQALKQLPPLNLETKD